MHVTLLFLHGWGGSKASFDPLREALAGTDLEILTPDLPGFGAEPDPPHPWTVEEYADWTAAWLKANRAGTGPLWILGHSHGGRIAIVLAARKQAEIERLFLCAPAINRAHRYLLRRMIGVIIAKIGKALLSLPGLSALAPFARTLLYKLLRVHDYERASPLMRETLVLVTRRDLSSLLPTITQEVDLFWGTDDTQTPVADAHFMKASLPRCTLHAYEGTRHAVHKTNAREIAAVLRQRLKSSR